MSILSPSYHLVFFAQTGSYFSKQMEECSFTEKLPSIFFINNSTMPDWLWFLSSSIYKIVLIYTFFYFFFLLCSQINIHRRYCMLIQLPMPNSCFPAVYRYSCIDCLRVNQTIIHWQNKVCLLFRTYFNVFYEGYMDSLMTKVIYQNELIL